jgi:hypothetical protein
MEESQQQRRVNRAVCVNGHESVFQGGRVKLAGLKSSIQDGEKLTVDEAAVSAAITTLRKFSYKVDQEFEGLEAKTHDRS